MNDSLAVGAVGWSNTPLSEISDFRSGAPISVSKLSRQSESNPIPVFGGNGIAGYTSSATNHEPTVILGRVGQKCGAVYQSTGDAWITDNALFASKFKRPLDVRFLAFALEAANLNSAKNHNDLPLITQSILRDIQIPWIESPGEQRAIAQALTDADSLATILERAIAKKQAMKQGAIQQLLTGRTRLPGFSALWSAAKLGDVGVFLKGRGVKRDDVRATGVPCIRYGELYTDFENYTDRAISFVDAEVAVTALPLEPGDLLFAGSGETRDEIGKCIAYVDEARAVAGGDLIILRGTGFNPVYLALLANTPSVVVQKSRAGQGDAVVHISSKALARIQVDLPPQDEQDAIVSVVLDLDREIDALRLRLAKARDVKQGMMQQMLTGRIRLAVQE